VNKLIVMCKICKEKQQYGDMETHLKKCGVVKPCTAAMLGCGWKGADPSHFQTCPFIALSPVLSKMLTRIDQLEAEVKQLKNQNQEIPKQKEKINFCFSKNKLGPRITLSNQDMTASSKAAWNQVQTEQEIKPGSFIDFKIDDMCPPKSNAFGIVIGIGPDSFLRSGIDAIVGYTKHHGCGVAGGGKFFATQSESCGKFATGDVIRIKYEEDGFVWEKNGQEFKKVAKSAFLWPENDTKFYPTVAISQGTVSILAENIQ